MDVCVNELLFFPLDDWCSTYYEKNIKENVPGMQTETVTIRSRKI